MYRPNPIVKCETHSEVQNILGDDVGWTIALESGQVLAVTKEALSFATMMLGEALKNAPTTQASDELIKNQLLLMLKYRWQEEQTH